MGWVKLAIFVTGAGSVLGLLVKFAPGFIGKEVAVALDDALAYLTLPEDKAAFKAVLACIDVRFPGMGDAKYAVAVDAMIARFPALAPSRQQLVDLFSGVGAAVKADLDAKR